MIEYKVLKSGAFWYVKEFIHNDYTFMRSGRVVCVVEQAALANTIINELTIALKRNIN